VCARRPPPTQVGRLLTVRSLGHKLNEITKGKPAQASDKLPAQTDQSTPAKWAVAQVENRIAERALDQMKTPRPQFAMEEPIAADNLHIAETHSRAAETVKQQIERKELLTADEFCEMLKTDTDWLESALDECRVFAITGPSGRSYYPAFYADPMIRREHIERVTLMLALLHPRSQYLFYTTIRTPQGETPLDALRAGRLDEVTAAALRAADDAPRRIPSIAEVLVGESWPCQAPPRHVPSESFADVLNGAKPR
jgi:hypothetical protein